MREHLRRWPGRVLFVGKAQEKTRVVRSERRVHEPSGSYYAVSVRNYVCGPPFGETGLGSPIPAIGPSVLKRESGSRSARRLPTAPHGGENTAPELTTPPSRSARRSGSRTRCVRRARTSAAPATSARRRAAPGRSASSPPGRSGSGPACGSRAVPRCSGSRSRSSCRSPAGSARRRRRTAPPAPRRTANCARYPGTSGPTDPPRRRPEPPPRHSYRVRGNQEPGQIRVRGPSRGRPGMIAARCSPVATFSPSSLRTPYRRSGVHQCRTSVLPESVQFSVAKSEQFQVAIDRRAGRPSLRSPSEPSARRTTPWVDRGDLWHGRRRCRPAEVGFRTAVASGIEADSATSV